MADTAHQFDHRYTYGEYVLWDGDERWELIDGEPYCMSPAPTRAHQWILVDFTRQLASALLGHRCQVYAAPFDVRLPEGNEVDDNIRTVVQPDVVVYCDPTKLDDRGARGAPDFAVEILSPSTTARDRRTKTDLYEKHGVREYWIVDPLAKNVEVRILGADGKWAAPTVHARGGRLRIAVLEGLEIDLSTVFAY